MEHDEKKHNNITTKRLPKIVVTVPHTGVGASKSVSTPVSSSTGFSPTREEIEKKISELELLRRKPELANCNSTILERKCNTKPSPSSTTQGFRIPSDILKLDVKDDSELIIAYTAKLLFDSRNATRTGDVKAGIVIVRDNLETIQAWMNQSNAPEDVLSSLLAATVELLAIQGNIEASRDRLRAYHSAENGRLRLPVRRPTILEPTTTIQVTINHGSHVIQSEATPEDETFLAQVSRAKQCLINLELDLWAEDIDKAIEDAKSLETYQSFFKSLDLNVPENRLASLRRILFRGQTFEQQAKPGGNRSVKEEHLCMALRMYTEGCELVEIHQRHMEHPNLPLTFHDHVHCANLFFSAARVCVTLDKEKFSTMPSELDCKPKLSAQNWKTQALEFLEMGRARALLSAIERIDSSADILEQNAREVLLTHERDQGSRLGDVLSSIPPDTIILEFSLASETIPGLLILAIERGNILKPHWKQQNVAPLRLAISDLLELMNKGRDADKKLAELQTASMKSGRSRKRFDEPKMRLSRSDAEKLVEDIEAEIHATVKELYATLLLPFGRSLQKAKKVIIIPSGDLAHIPWSLVLQLSGIHDKEISLMPSLRIWRWLQEQRESKIKDNLPIPISNQAAMVVCNSPKITLAEFENPVQLSRVESYYIARSFGVFPFLADQSPRSDFETQAAQAKILHFSAHADFDKEFPLLSSLDLFPRKTKPADFFNLTIKAGLVVLSCCMSAYSRVFDSGTALSFAHVLLGRGTSSFIGALWDVHDITCVTIMTLFYNYLHEGSSPKSALRQAQAKLRNMDQKSMDDLYKLYDCLTEVLKKDKSSKREKYVKTYTYWIDHVLKMRDSTVEQQKAGLKRLSRPWSWAGFILIGDGEMH